MVDRNKQFAELLDCIKTDIQLHYSRGKYKLKQKGNLLPSDWQKKKKKENSVRVGDALTLLVRSIQSTISLQDILAIPAKL